MSDIRYVVVRVSRAGVGVGVKIVGATKSPDRAREIAEHQPAPPPETVHAYAILMVPAP